MKPLLIGLGILIVVAAIIGSMFVGTYNRLTNESVSTDTAWATVQTQYQRRFDLVPNLVAATKGALGQEQKVFGDIAEARTHYAGAAQGSNDQVQATSQYESALARLMVIVEAYPQLQSIGTIHDLMSELAGTENRVQIARDRYNAQVQVYDTDIRSFPSNIFASIYGFSARDYFKPDEGSEKAPTVNLQ